MVRFYPLGPSLQRDFARFIDDHGEEELQGFGCAECINKALLSGAPQSLADTLTDNDGGGLRDFSDLLVLLHDALDSRLKEKERERASGLRLCGTEVVQESDRGGGCSRRTTGNLVVLFLFFIVGAVVAVRGGEGGAGGGVGRDTRKVFMQARSWC